MSWPGGKIGSLRLKIWDCRVGSTRGNADALAWLRECVHVTVVCDKSRLLVAVET